MIGSGCAGNGAAVSPDGRADGLGVTTLTVANAALDAMGIATRPVEVTDSIQTAKIDPSLSDGNRRVIVSMIREMRVDAAASSAGFIDAAERFAASSEQEASGGLPLTRTTPPGYVSPGRAIRDAPYQAGEEDRGEGDDA